MTDTNELSPEAVRLLQIIEAARAMDTPPSEKYPNAAKGLLRSKVAEEFLSAELKKHENYGIITMFRKISDELIAHGHITSEIWAGSVEGMSSLLQWFESQSDLSPYRQTMVQSLRSTLGLNPMHECSPH